MRNELKATEGERHRYQGRFERYGEKSSYKGPPTKTILFKNITSADTNQIVCNHIWFTCGKQFFNLGELQQGDLVEFVARSAQYEKGYNGYRNDVRKPHSVDFKLSHPTQVKKADTTVL